MKHFDIKMEIPEGYEEEAESISRSIDWNKIVKNAFRRALEEEVRDEILLQVAEKIAAKSKMSEEQARVLSEELKNRIAKRHWGL